MATKIYLAGACYNEPDEGRAWREKATEILKQVESWVDKNVVVINPTQYFSYSENKHKTHKQVKNFYMNKIRNCDLVLCNLNNSAASVGTGQEVQFAVDHHIPVIGFGTENVYPWIEEVDCDVVFSNMVEAIDYIRDYYL